ncbi:MAG TPA: hypothetical protein VMK12_22380 [Anaeromyxobacteraceae bacterium]|nr:hypothetical protein [Anaeromyxobacteraceae bacterium]
MKIAYVVLPVALAGCALFGQRESGLVSRPAGDEGMLLFTVGRLSFEGPAGWQAQGSARHVVLVSPHTDARIDAQVMDRTFHSDRQCLAQAEDSLARGAGRFRNIRRHPTTLAGREALVQEADEGAWHGWAWAVCDGGEQYRIFFTGHSPLDEEAVRASRLLASSVVLLRGPGA